jgi:hypothetical protein
VAALAPGCRFKDTASPLRGRFALASAAWFAYIAVNDIS